MIRIIKHPNEHLSIIGSRMANKIKRSKSYKDFLNNPNIHNFYINS